jgi:hypothetical protein
MLFAGDGFHASTLFTVRDAVEEISGFLLGEQAFEVSRDVVLAQSEVEAEEPSARIENLHLGEILKSETAIVESSGAELYDPEFHCESK